MIASWRWFGPSDPMPLSRIGQTGAMMLETSLAELSAGAVWTEAAIRERRELVDACRNANGETLRWEVLGGIPIHNDIKLGRGDRTKYINIMSENMRRLCGQGVRRILINVMPLIDWVRTDLAQRLPTGATSVSYDAIDVTAFDLFIIARPNAERDYSAGIIDAARDRFVQMSQTRRDHLLNTLATGLPGGDSHQDVSEFKYLLSDYNALDVMHYRQNIFDFIGAICRVLEEEGGVLGVHPDDPPWQICGLPRIMASLEDYQALFEAVPSPANGILLCSGALGASPKNDLPAIARALKGRVHYAHLRTVRQTGSYAEAGWSFEESEHLSGDIDLYDIATTLVDEEHQRRANGNDPFHATIPFRADHGQHILDDLDAAETNPGYAPVGMTKATAELRGMIYAIERNRE
ncbi:MAG: mannonate dehydratase, partial [Hyphomicrobiales bacterium]